jgi:hypothetical protein
MAWACTRCHSKLVETGWPSWTPANQEAYDTYKEAYQQAVLIGNYRQAKEFEAILDTLKKQRMEAQYDHSAAIPIFRGPMTTAGREYPIRDDVNWVQHNGQWKRAGELKFDDISRAIIQFQGVPPMAISSGGEYASEPNAVRYDHAAAEKATIHPPGCTCAPCVVVTQNQQIKELNDRIIAEVRHSADLYDLASKSLYAESNTRKNLDKVAARAREVAAVPVIRVGDTERNLYIEHLGNMYSDGHLTQEEFSERSDKANEAKTMDDLRPLVADLPSMVTVSSRDVEVVKQRTPLLNRVVTPAMGIWALGSIALLLLLLVLGVV